MNEQYISGKEFCSHHQIEIHFLHSLHEYGLIEIENTEEDCLLQPQQVADIEKMLRLHYELQVNFEGIDVIRNMLQQMEELQAQMAVLQIRLKYYEDKSV